MSQRFGGNLEATRANRTNVEVLLAPFRYRNPIDGYLLAGFNDDERTGVAAVLASAEKALPPLF